MNKKEILQRLVVFPTGGPIYQLRNQTLRVAGYKRVGVSDPVQMIMAELFRAEWASYISSVEKWTDAGLYVDEGKEYASRDKLLAACRAGFVDLVITKSIIRFFRSPDEAVKVISELAELHPPVGLLFESDGLYALCQEQFDSFHIGRAFSMKKKHIKGEIDNG